MTRDQLAKATPEQRQRVQDTEDKLDRGEITTVEAIRRVLVVAEEMGLAESRIDPVSGDVEYRLKEATHD